MVESVVHYVVERLGDLLIEEAMLLSGVNEQVKQIQAELKRMQCFLEDAERRQDEDASVRNWVLEIRNLAYDVEDVIEIYALKIASKRNKVYQNPIKRSINLHKLGSKIEFIKYQISDLTRSLQTYGLNAKISKEGSNIASEMQRQLRWSYSHVVEEFIVGLDEDIEKLVAQLLNQDKYCQVVSICGMGGLGKTTLAKKVYHHDSVRRHFQGFAWACISQQCKKRDVWKGILLKLIAPTKDERDEIMKLTDEEIAKKLYQVQQKKECLVILDDIWKTEDWDILRPAFPSENTRTKIVVTSRNKEVALHVDQRGLIHEPGCLNEDESWELFQKKAFLRKDDPEFTIGENIEKLGREMVGKCAGLPLAIIVLGGLLATKDTTSEWETVHRYLTSYLIRGEAHEKQSRLAEVLALSYHDLPFQLKPCFLYLSHFPEDSDIPTNKLIRLWVAEGVVVSSQYETDRDVTMEDAAERYLGNLINRCMVQVGTTGTTGRIKTCRLHDLMRDLCLSKARQENFLLIVNGSQENNPSFSQSISRVRRMGIWLGQHLNETSFSNQQVNPHLRSLLYFHDKRYGVENWIRECVFGNFKLLRVLDLEGFKGFCALPKEVGNLLWLRFLSLKKTHIQELPISLGNLEYLQTLNLQTLNKVSWDSTVHIPNVLCKLKRLRHLYLPNWCGNITDNLQLANLSNLQTLVNFPANKCDVKDLLKLSNLRKLVLNDPRYFEKFGAIFNTPNNRLNFLHSLSLKTDMLSFPDKVVDVGQLLVGCPRLHKLHLEGQIERLPEYNQFPPSLAKLTLWGSRLVEDPMVTLEKLPNLRFLSGWEMFTGKKMVCTGNGFPQLKSLLLRGFPNLEEWEMENQAMPNLCRLGISDCNKLKTVPNGLRYIATLRNIEIRWMPKSFKNKLESGGVEFYKVQHVPSIVFLN
ncbi:Disease resistance protein [Quillaja saponaria]|uniref:Disease resistance protein n=1 Tax=Quillaja saponaria TaxID=32244 RepID=A0AAD7PXQ2_QUISA|nr:Disease resistance protein [Quillaja saponaria]